MAVSSILEVASKNYILDAGPLIIKSNVGDQMIVQGWASTDDIDLSKEIVEAKAFEQDFPFYQKSGFYWFNHDPNQVIGHVEEMSLKDHGFYIDKAQLSETKWNREWLWPHLKSKAISQHSIQFQSIGPKINPSTGILHHKRVKLIETSIVSIACNPAAVITGLKTLLPTEDYLSLSLPELFKLHQQGLLKNPSDVRTHFSMPGLRDGYPEQPPVVTEAETTPHHVEVEKNNMDLVINPRDKATRDIGGEKLKNGLPNKVSKQYDAVGTKLFVAKSSLRGSYVFRVASLTAKGWDYDWNHVAASMGYALGVKNNKELAAGERALVIPALLEAYDALGKKQPTYKSVNLSDVSDAVLDTLVYADIEFHNDEADIVKAEICKSVCAQFDSMLASYAKTGLPSELLTHIKSVYPSLYIDFYVSLREPADFDFVNTVLQAVKDYTEQDNDDDMDSYYMSLEGKQETEIKQIKIARCMQKMLQKYLDTNGLNDECLTLKAQEVTTQNTVESKSEKVVKGFEHLFEDSGDIFHL